MDKKILLERRLSNRMSRQDLISRGIISESHAGVFVSSNLSQLNRIQKGNFINSRISQRPSREDLAKLRILNIGLDLEEASFVREKLNDHLRTRPGPLEVLDYLVYPASDGSPRSIHCYPLKIQPPQGDMCPIKTNDNIEYFVVNPADGSLIKVSCRDPMKTHKSCDLLSGNVKQKTTPSFINGYDIPCQNFLSQRSNQDKTVKPNIVKKSQKPVPHKKFTNYNFHEYKPQSTAAGNRFIKCTDARNLSHSNYQESEEHYRLLIEQQALFLQYEVANRCGNAGKDLVRDSVPPQFQDLRNSFSGVHHGSSPIPSNSFSMNNQSSNYQNTSCVSFPNNNMDHVSPPLSPLGEVNPVNVCNDFQNVPVAPDVYMRSPSPFQINHNQNSSSFSPLPRESSVPPVCTNHSKSFSFENYPTTNRMMRGSNSNIIASLMDDENIISDVRSSDYMNSLYSDLSEFEQPYIGFGGILDFDDFPSISEKVALYEQLSTNVP